MNLNQYKISEKLRCCQNFTTKETSIGPFVSYTQVGTVLEFIVFIRISEMVHVIRSQFYKRFKYLQLKKYIYKDNCLKCMR